VRHSAFGNCRRPPFWNFPRCIFFDRGRHHHLLLWLLLLLLLLLLFDEPTYWPFCLSALSLLFICAISQISIFS